MENSLSLPGLSPDARAELDRCAVRRDFGAGEAIYRQGDQPRELSLLLSGRVRIWRATEPGGAFTVALLRRGDTMGIFGAAGKTRPLSVTATAITPIRVAAWRLEDVRRLIAVQPSLGASLLATISDHAIEMIDRLEELSAIPVEQRLARTLLRAIGGDGPGDDARNTLPLSRQDLADLVFSTLPTVSRIMSRWRAAGLTDGGRGQVKLLDRIGLSAAASGACAGETFG